MHFCLLKANNVIEKGKKYLSKEDADIWVSRVRVLVITFYTAVCPFHRKGNFKNGTNVMVLGRLLSPYLFAAVVAKLIGPLGDLQDDQK